MEEQLGNFGQYRRTTSLVDHFGSLAVLLVLCAAIVLHSLTGIVFLAAAIVAIHGGWKSMHCGLWLLSSDPLPFRRWPCFWFYTSAAFFKATVWALLAFVLLAANEAFTGKPPTEEQLAARGMTTVVAMGLTAIIGIVAVISAIRHRMRIWVHPDIREKCGSDFCRVGESRAYVLGKRIVYSNGFNHAVFVLAISLFLPAICVLMLLLFCSFEVNAAPNRNLTTADILRLVTFFGVIFAIIPAYAFLSHRVIAQTPTECWPPATLWRSEDLPS